jgi:hypothetical protein
LSQLADEALEIEIRRRPFGDQDDILPARKKRLVAAVRLANQPLDAVALYGSTHLFTGGDPDSRPFPRDIQQKQKEMGGDDLAAAALHLQELAAAAEPFGGSEGFRAHADSSRVTSSTSSP